MAAVRFRSITPCVRRGFGAGVRCVVVDPDRSPAVLPDPRQASRTGFARGGHSGWRRRDSADAAIEWRTVKATVSGLRPSDHSTGTPAAGRCRGAVRTTTASPPRSRPVPLPRSDPPALPAKLARPCACVHASAIGRRPTEPSRPANPTFAWSISVPTCRGRTTPIAAGPVPTAVPRAAADTGSPRAPDRRAANDSGAGHRAPADTGPNTRRFSRPSTASRARPPAAPRRPARRIAAGPPPVPTPRVATGGRQPVRLRGTRRDSTGRALAT